MPSKTETSFLRRNGLSLVLLGLFLAFWLGQMVSGFHANNDERLEEGLLPLTMLAYLHTGHFISATFENWESEFLQMGMYVLLTISLRQKGSAESRPLDPEEEEERIDPGPTPWPVVAGGIWRALYKRSLAMAYVLFFVATLAGHAYGSWLHENEQRLADHRPVETLMQHVSGSQFWFESLQNWQSEFLAVLSIVVLTIYLRQDKSPESKPLRAPHSQTGT